MSIDKTVLQEYLEGRLSDSQEQSVQLFLADHMDDPEVLRLLDGEFENCRQEADYPDEKALSATRLRLGLDRQRSLKWGLAAAVAALLLAAPALLRIGYGLHRETPQTAWNEISVPYAQTQTLELSDGTVLTLNAGTRITWPESFTAQKREVFLEGEVLASVAKDPEKPFVIHSGDVDVVVHGTTFNLKSYRGDTRVEVMLMEGSVSLDLPSGDGRREVTLTPGDMALYDRSDGNVSLVRMPSETFKPFSEGRSFSFFNTPLTDIASSLERSFGTRIVIGDGAIASRRFLAFFTNGESLDEILALLSKNGGLRISRSGSDIYLYDNLKQTQHHKTNNQLNNE